MVGSIFVLGRGGCVARPIASAFLTIGQIPISASVGNGAPNRSSDVRAIQENLNKVPVKKGGPVPPLAVDGIVGPKTVAAIHLYQKTNLGWSDGRVDPLGATIRQLTLDADPEHAPDEQLVKAVLQLSPRARTCIHAAENALLAAKLEGSFGGERSRQLLEKHFELSRFPNADDEFRRVQRVFQTMLNVLTPSYGRDPLVEWTGVFVPNTSPIMDRRACAYAYGGGHSMPTGATDSNERVPFRHRQDRIYICRPMMLESQDWQTMSIVHELAHFVGPQSDNPNHIKDYAYGPSSDATMKKLFPWHRTRNAQSYANFAYECAFGYEAAWR